MYRGRKFVVVCRDDMMIVVRKDERKYGDANKNTPRIGFPQPAVRW